MKDKLTSSEFKEMIKTGQLDVTDGKLVSGKYPIIEKKLKKQRKPTLEMNRTTILETIKEYADQGKVYIPYDVRSSKNSKQIRYKSLEMSPQAKEYRILSMQWWTLQTKLFKELTEGKEYPLNIGFYWIRSNKQRWDYSNLLQMPQDLMVELKWLPDDNINYLKPIIEGFEVNKEKRGLIISIH
jgi:Holliday junction resolvase RusA-like endonuclease